MAQATKLSPQQLTDAAKAPLLAYGRKDWDAVKASITPDFVYEEVANDRKVQGVDALMPLWKGWAAAFPDSAPTFHSALVSGDSVITELTWTGTHTGPLETPNGTIAATGKRINMRSCVLTEIDGDKGKAKLQRQYFDMATMLRQIGVAS